METRVMDVVAVIETPTGLALEVAVRGGAGAAEMDR